MFYLLLFGYVCLFMQLVTSRPQICLLLVSACLVAAFNFVSPSGPRSCVVGGNGTRQEQQTGPS